MSSVVERLQAAEALLRKVRNGDGRDYGLPRQLSGGINEFLASLHVGAKQPECEPMHPDAEGWSEWIHPLPGYLMQCCDCNLIHEMEFAIGETIDKGGPFNEGEDENGVIVFRARRASLLPPQSEE